MGPTSAVGAGPALRLGLCCTFLEQPIRFRRTTARQLQRLGRAAGRALLREIVAHNAHALALAIDWCATHGVGAFRVNSEILPLATHPLVGYRLEELDPHGAIARAYAQAGRRARAAGIRLSFHPDQFVVPGSTREDVVASSLAELEHQAFLATLIGAEQITLHAGGAEGGKAAALERLRRAIARLSPLARSLLVLENDDRIYAPSDLLPLCHAEGIPLAYDVHHHRCNPDSLSVEEATRAAAATWAGREPFVHLSSPLGGWRVKDPRRHADFVRPGDLPRIWLGMRLTVDVEAKAKELAVLRLARWLATASAPGCARRPS